MTEFHQSLSCLSDSVQTTLQAVYRKDVRWQPETALQAPSQRVTEDEPDPGGGDLSWDTALDGRDLRNQPFRATLAERRFQRLNWREKT